MYAVMDEVDRRQLMESLISEIQVYLERQPNGKYKYYWLYRVKIGIPATNLATKAAKEIAGRYGGLENLGDKLKKSENFEMAIGEIVWLAAGPLGVPQAVHGCGKTETRVFH